MSKVLTIEVKKPLQKKIDRAYDVKKNITDLESEFSQLSDDIKSEGQKLLPQGASSVNLPGSGEVAAQVQVRRSTPTLNDGAVQKARELTGPMFPLFFDESATSTNVVIKLKPGKEEALRAALKAAGLDPDEFTTYAVETQVKVKKEWATLHTINGNGMSPAETMLGKGKAKGLLDLVTVKPDSVALKFVTN